MVPKPLELLLRFSYVKSDLLSLLAFNLFSDFEQTDFNLWAKRPAFMIKYLEHKECFKTFLRYSGIPKRITVCFSVLLSCISFVNSMLTKSRRR